MIQNGIVKNQIINANGDKGRGVMVTSLESWLEKYPDGEWTGPPEYFFMSIFRMATEEGGFFRSLDVGVIPGGGATQRLSRAVGKFAAMRLLMTGEMIEAREALAIGLASRVVSDDEVMTEAMRLATRIAGLPAFALRQIKELVLESMETGLDAGLRSERKAFQLMFTTPFCVREAAKLRIGWAIHNDVRFLADLQVLDYSLLVGVDRERNELVVGIIDFLTSWTAAKKAEYIAKNSGLLGQRGKVPTIVPPIDYGLNYCHQKLFRLTYFMYIQPIDFAMLCGNILRTNYQYQECNAI